MVKTRLLCSETNKRSKKFLIDIMGQELFNKLDNEGMIEIKSGKNTYELYKNGHITNRTTGQLYCIVPESNYPMYDTIAIKYAWLKYRPDIVDAVHIKGDRRRTRQRLYYNDFVNDMEQGEWTRKRMIIDEHSPLVTTYEVQAGYPGTIIDVRCPKYHIITIAGLDQISISEDVRTAHSISLKIVNKDDVEINKNTVISMDRVTQDANTVILTSYIYSLLRSGVCIDNNEHKKYICACKIDKSSYRHYAGIYLLGNELLRIRIINPNITILPEDIRVNIECDFWTRHDS